MSSARNPWLSPPDSVELPMPEVISEQLPPATGPQTPQNGVPVPAAKDLLSITDRTSNADLWWIGTHGGSGESSLAALVDGWAAAEHSWPRPLDGGSAHVVLVARTSMTGLLSAQAAAIQWASGSTPAANVMGLVLVADAPGKLPRQLRDFARLISGGVPRTWSVPWIDSWRLGEGPSLSDVPREVRRLIDDLHQLIRASASAPGKLKGTP